MSEENTPLDKPSKSARKRELLALQELAERMSGLADGQLHALGVDAPLREALAQLRGMKPSGARNRQLKHCVRFMDPSELAEVTRYLDDQRAYRSAAKQSFHEIERWRDRLIDEGDKGLEVFLETHPLADRQHLRRLCRDAARERVGGKPAGAARKLFRYLRELNGAD